MMKFIRFWRKLFNLAEPEVEYNIVITDSATQQSKKERLNYTEFFNNLVKRAKYYSAIVSPQSGVFGKISAQTNDKILDFLERAPRKDAAPLEAYYEVVPFADEEVVERRSVLAPVVDQGTFAALFPPQFRSRRKMGKLQ